MIANNPMSPVCEYATDSQYKEAPNQEQLSCGVIPLDSLPAEWWNYLWGNANQQINNGVVALNNVIAEIINVMSAAGISPVSECTDQLKTSIQLLAQCIGTSTKAGAVKSSSTCGQVSISDTGIMTANGLGNASNLTTTNKGNVVAAINELKSQHEQQITDLESYVQGLQNSTVTGVKLNSSGTVINPTSGIIDLGLGSAAKCDITCFLSSDSLKAYAKQNGYFTGASDSWVCCANNASCLGGTLADCYALKSGTIAVATQAVSAVSATNASCLGGTRASCYALKSGTVACATSATSAGSAASATYATNLGTSSAYHTYTSLNNAINGKAPTNHASSATSYGVASSSLYGHVKLVQTYGSACNTYCCEMGSTSCCTYIFNHSTYPIYCICLRASSGNRFIWFCNYTSYPLLILECRSYGCIPEVECLSKDMILPRIIGPNEKWGMSGTTSTSTAHCGIHCLRVAPLKCVLYF